MAVEFDLYVGHLYCTAILSNIVDHKESQTSASNRIRL